MDAKLLLEQAVTQGASDIFIIAGLPVSCRINGVITRVKMIRGCFHPTRRQFWMKSTGWPGTAISASSTYTGMMIFPSPYRAYPVSVSVPTNREGRYPR